MLNLFVNKVTNIIEAYTNIIDIVG